MLSAWAAALVVGAAALRRHLAGQWRRLERALPLLASSHPQRLARGGCLRPQAPPLQAPTKPASGRACWWSPLQGALAMAGHPCKGPSRGEPPLSSLRLL
ncbi:hypothetical protein B296_00036038 [Ensete ventricosum]|uniref:Uncharacterized protein n=1 Tax=Ensete ventricosum TaxID=4639 RepID=A0A426X5A5_ENSVE|nr:hypothetical protein B296_00036038 [Ensete ventricosum]